MEVNLTLGVPKAIELSGLLIVMASQFWGPPCHKQDQKQLNKWNQTDCDPLFMVAPRASSFFISMVPSVVLKQSFMVQISRVLLMSFDLQKVIQVADFLIVQPSESFTLGSFSQLQKMGRSITSNQKTPNFASHLFQTVLFCKYKYCIVPKGGRPIRSHGLIVRATSQAVSIIL